MGADSLAENTQNAPPNFWPNLSVQPQKSLEFSKKKTLSGCPQSVLERQEIDCKSCFFRLFWNPPAFSWLGIRIKGYQRAIYYWVLTKRPLKPGSCIFMIKISPMLQFSNTKESYKSCLITMFLIQKLNVFQTSKFFRLFCHAI